MGIEVKNVNIVLFDFSKLILLQQRTDDTEIYPGCWSFFGGSIEENESFGEALVRETLEELEYRLKNPFFVMEQECKEGSYHGKRRIYMEQYDFIQKLVFHEGKGMGWFSLLETRSIRMGEWDREVIAYIENKF